MKWLMAFALSGCATMGFVEHREQMCRLDVCPELAKSRGGFRSRGHYDPNGGNCLCSYNSSKVKTEKEVSVPVDTPLHATDDDLR